MAERDRHDARRRRGNVPSRPRAGVRERIDVDRDRRASSRRRPRIVWGIVLLAMVAAGAVLAATAGGSVVRSAIAIVALGSAAVLVVVLAFLEVGLSEDEDRRRHGRFGRAPRDLEQRGARFRRDDPRD
jgi:choline-glycine betaine transporter